MPEQDPREYRGGVHEPSDAKSGAADNEGIVPRDMIDDPPPQEGADDQTLGDNVLGGVSDGDPTDDSIDRTGGDNADATKGTTGSTAEGDSQWNAANSAPGDVGA